MKVDEIYERGKASKRDMSEGRKEKTVYQRGRETK